MLEFSVMLPVQFVFSVATDKLLGNIGDSVLSARYFKDSARVRCAPVKQPSSPVEAPTALTGYQRKRESAPGNKESAQ